MENIYKFKLPKDREVTCVNTEIENGELNVRVKFREKFEPKDGDFLVSSRGNVFIYNGKCTSIEYGAYCGISVTGEFTICTISTAWTPKEGCRHATEQEKADFLERLEKECHKRWNAETKLLEDIRWRPKEGEIYYLINEFCGISETGFYKDFISDKNRIAVNNCFKTREAAQKVANQIEEIFKNSKAE